jgi:hypothetical protein
VSLHALALPWAQRAIIQKLGSPEVAGVVVIVTLLSLSLSLVGW